MKTWAAVLVLIIFSFLLAGSLVASVGDSAESRLLDPVPPTPTPGPAGQATLDGHDQPVETPPLLHRQSVLERFPCSDCHGVERGWLMPENHATMGLGECLDCHRMAPAPPAIAVHETMDHDMAQESCGLCHSNLVAPPERVSTQLPSCVSCHGTDVAKVLPISHVERSPSTSTCIVCHETTVLEVPVMHGTPDGWQRCTFCHGPQRLTPLEGAHERVAEDRCLSCHTSVQYPPDTYVNMHDLSEDQGGCFSCHAEGQLAPLPDSHADRPEALCMLCHDIAHEQPPSGPHALAGQGACDTCHAPEDVGALPDSHIARTEEMCVACHKEDKAPAIPHDLEKRGNCEVCHAPSSGE